MHYYKRHLGDYAKKAGHLSPLEHGVYNLILDSYYDREHAPTLLEATRWARARTEEERQAVLAVLDEFFILENERYAQKRVEEELADYHKKAETNRVIAVEREKQKRERKERESSTKGKPEKHEPCTTGQPNHKPLTINHNISPIPPKGGDEEGQKKQRGAIALKTFLTECKAAGEKPIPDGHPVFDYAAEAGISETALEIHWNEFLARYKLDGAKKYKAWRTVFSKSVRGNWFKLWYFDQQGQCTLTSVGVQAKNIADAAKRGAR